MATPAPWNSLASNRFWYDPPLAGLKVQFYRIHSPRHPNHSTLIFARSPHNILPINKSMLSSPEVSQAQHCAYDRPPGRPSSISRHPSIQPLRTVSAPTWPGCSPWFCTSGSNLPTSNSQTFSNPFRMRSYKQTPCFARFWPKLSVSNSFRMRSYKNPRS